MTTPQPRGSITASCGHKLTEREGMGHTILICELTWGREEDEEGNQAYSTEIQLTVCDKCLKKYERRGNIICRFN